MLFKIASRLSKTVLELEQTLTWSEFKEWSQYFEIEDKQHTKLDYYMAQIAAMCVAPWSKKQPKTKDFLIKFSKSDRSPKTIAKKLASWLGITLPEDKNGN